jgi:hypothetical protein
LIFLLPGAVINEEKNLVGNVELAQKDWKLLEKMDWKMF